MESCTDIGSDLQLVEKYVQKHDEETKSCKQYRKHFLSSLIKMYLKNKHYFSSWFHFCLSI